MGPKGTGGTGGTGGAAPDEAGPLSSSILGSIYNAQLNGLHQKRGETYSLWGELGVVHGQSPSTKSWETSYGYPLVQRDT